MVRWPVIEIRHLAANPAVLPIARYFDAFVGGRGCKPDRIQVSRKEFAAILRLARKRCLDPMKRTCDRISFQGVPVVAL